MHCGRSVMATCRGHVCCGRSVMAMRRGRVCCKRPMMPMCGEKIWPCKVQQGQQSGRKSDIGFMTICGGCAKRRDVCLDRVQVMSLAQLGMHGVSPSLTPILILLTSSTGDGDPPDNAVAFLPRWGLRAEGWDGCRAVPASVCVCVCVCAVVCSCAGTLLVLVTRCSGGGNEVVLAASSSSPTNMQALAPWQALPLPAQVMVVVQATNSSISQGLLWKLAGRCDGLLCDRGQSCVATDCFCFHACSMALDASAPGAA